MIASNLVPENLWRVVSRGYAAENLKIDDVYLEVYCPELSGFADGEINSDPVEFTTQGVDDRGNNYTCKIKTTNSIRTKWRQQGTNRISAPCVRRGERVEVWQYADADMYYWSTTGEDDALRRLETVTFAFSNTQDESTKELTPENSYWTTVNTHEKIIALETSQSDGEPYKHAMQIDAKTGNFHYRDSANNYIQVEAASNTITVENGDGVKVVLVGANAEIFAPGDLGIKCRNLRIDAKSISMNADNVATTASKNTLTGDLETTGAVSNNGKNIGSSHRHGGVESGGSSTSGPQ